MAQEQGPSPGNLHMQKFTSIAPPGAPGIQALSDHLQIVDAKNRVVLTPSHIPTTCQKSKHMRI